LTEAPSFFRPYIGDYDLFSFSAHVAREGGRRAGEKDPRWKDEDIFAESKKKAFLAREPASLSRIWFSDFFVSRRFRVAVLYATSKTQAP
jgi:hypothetical protein